MKKWCKKWLVLMLVFAVVACLCPQAASFVKAAEADTMLTEENAGKSVDTDVAESGRDTSEAETDASAQTGTSDKDVTLGLAYVVVNEPELVPPATQQIVVGMSDESAVCDRAELTVYNETDGQYQKYEAAEIQDGALLFEISYAAGETGSYCVTSLSYTYEGEETTVDLSEIGIEACYGVGVEVESDPDTVIESDDESDEAEALDELDVDVSTINEDGELESADSVEEIVEEGLELGSAVMMTSRLEASNSNSTDSGQIVVALDAGHDSTHTGASSTYGGVTYKEQDLTLKIAQYCKQELEKYDGIVVYMLRSSTSCPSGKHSSAACNAWRVERAKEIGASYYISFHLNSSDNNASGAEVYYPNSNYRSDLGVKGKALAEDILDQLTELGLRDRGVKIRNSEDGTKYADGSLADYLSVIRRSKNAGICAVLIEHAFLSNSGDVSKYLSSDAKLQKLGVADATGIANYLGLSESVTTTEGVSYSVYAQDYGWMPAETDGETVGTVGKSKRVEALKIQLQNSSTSGSIQYRAYCQDYGWRDWVTDGAIAGTTGESKRLEAVQIQLTGEMAEKYDIYYRVHVQDFGWLDWAKNGESAGSFDYAKRLEAIQIKLVAKGSAAPGSTSTPYVYSQIACSAHVQDIGWQGWTPEASTAGTIGQSKRVEAIKIKLQNQDVAGSVEYKTHVQDIGWQDWVSSGQIAGTTGQSKRMEAICIRLTGEMAEKYDIYYRVHVQDYGWLGWAKNGEEAGTEGLSKRMEAIQIQLVEKGQSAPGSTKNAFKTK